MSLEARTARLAALARARNGPAGIGRGTSEGETLSIGALYRKVDRAIHDALPGQVWVTGEVRSLSVSARGICYMELADPAGRQDGDRPVLKAVCWSRRWVAVRSRLDRLGIALDAGLVVRVRGEVQLYRPRGEISFIVSDLDTDALLGKVAAERARVVKALVDADLYDRNRRVPVAPVPCRIGLVASPGSEGYRDFLGQLAESGMGFDVRVMPTRVQGRGAPALVAGAVRRLQGAGCDIIVMVRGGGSKADLAAFDGEPVARAIAHSEVAVWTGIGHTGDLSVADEVANRAFVTPTDCGRELAAQVVSYWQTSVGRGLEISRLAGRQLGHSVDALDRRRRSVEIGGCRQLDRHADRLVHRAAALRGATRRQVDSRRGDLASRSFHLSRSSIRVLRDEEQWALGRVLQLAGLPTRCLEKEELRTSHRRSLIGAYDYQRQLERGYSVTRDADGAVVRSVRDVEPGSELRTEVADGRIASSVSTVVAAPPPDGTVRDEGDG